MTRGILKKIISIVVAINIILCFFSGCSSIKVSANSCEEKLKIHFLDVAQGDCIVLEQGEHFMLIDAGKEKDEEKIASYLKKVGVQKFDYVVGTHAHDDHIGSLDYVVNNYEIDKLFMPYVKNTDDLDYQKLLEACNEKKLKIKTVKKGKVFRFGNAVCTVVSPKGTNYEEINDYSIVMRITYGDSSFLFTADAQDVSENEMVSEGVELKADLIKIAHHGIDTSSSEEFLDAVNPKYAVVSVAGPSTLSETYHVVMDRLKNRNVEIYRTDEKGDIVAESDGKTITFSTEK